MRAGRPISAPSGIRVSAGPTRLPEGSAAGSRRRGPGPPVPGACLWAPRGHQGPSRWRQPSRRYFEKTYWWSACEVGSPALQRARRAAYPPIVQASRKGTFFNCDFYRVPNAMAACRPPRLLEQGWDRSGTAGRVSAAAGSAPKRRVKVGHFWPERCRFRTFSGPPPPK